tara:strand:+ start:4865 stop:5605 length:741 start_codon:yes stop_codon:yes gene_type:complete
MQEVKSVLNVIRATQDHRAIARGTSRVANEKRRLCSLYHQCDLANLWGDGVYDNPIEIDQVSATLATLDNRVYWQQNSDDDSGDDAYIWSSAAKSLNPAILPMLRIKFSLNQLATLRMWQGFFDQNGTNVVNTDDPDGDYAAIRYSTNASDTTWKYITSADDTSTVTDSGIAPVADQIYHLEIEFETTGVRFRIEDENKLVLNEQTVTTNRPRDHVAELQLFHGLETLEAVAKSWRFYIADIYALY